MAALKLFMLVLGCSPEGRHTEQHDVFFGIGLHLRDLIPDVRAFWPASKQTAFYKHTSFGEATSHVDDKYGIDVDDVPMR